MSAAEEIQIFYDRLKDATDECRKRGREIMIGGDFNASVGTQEECNEAERRVIGPHGVNQRSSCGNMVIQMAAATNLKATTSFFKDNHHSTFKDSRNDTSRQLDCFLADISLGTKVIDAKKRLARRSGAAATTHQQSSQ
jgi:hypothetical protein